MAQLSHKGSGQTWVSARDYASWSICRIASRGLVTFLVMRTEAEFLDALDCRFPYEQEAQAHRLIDEACAISANAAFMVVHELARPPQGVAADDSACLALLERVAARFEHPLRDAVVGVARRMLAGERLQVHECVELMRAVARHRGQFSALAVVYFSCDDAGIETVDTVYEEIVGVWRRSS